jgi:glycosyltransferase involved in cell wall biosynthesis
VPSGDVGALAAAIVTLASDPGRVRRFGAAARERALAGFSAERSADGVEQVYREALAR